LSVGAGEAEHAVVFDLAVALDPALAVPAIAGEAAGVTDAVELAVAQGNDLDAELLVGDVAGILALEGEVGIFGGLFGVDVGDFLVGGEG
jgi:hypothetical protein